MTIIRRFMDWLPRDMELPDEEFRSRHMAMTVMLALHVPILAVFGWRQGAELMPLGIELAVPTLLLVVGSLPVVHRTARAFAVASGLLFSSIILLQLSGGAAEAALHFLIVLAFVFLYRVWSLFAWAIVVMALNYQVLGLLDGFLGDAIGLPEGGPEMALGALVTAGSLASIGLVLAWKSAGEHLSSAVAATEQAKEQEEAAKRRDAYGKMYVNLARRSQSLVGNQLAVIDRLEQEIEDPDVLAEVFELDHLTTRIRRHGESLLVVADVDLPVRSEEQVALSDVVRGAQSEIEQYRRVDARVEPAVVVSGKVTRDLVHLLAELLDNATTYSPPNTTVKVHARSGDAGAVVLTVEDGGLGMTPERLAQANADLQDTEALDENSIRHLGLRVVARLAEKHGINVRLTSNNSGGITAWVELPSDVVTATEGSELAPARIPEVSAPAAPEAPSASAPAPAAETPAPPAPNAPATDQPAPQRPAPSAPSAPSTDAPSPAPLPAGFSASSARRRRSRNPVAKKHDNQRNRAPKAPPSAPSPPTTPATPPAAPVDRSTEPPERPPTVDQPLPTRAVRAPRPDTASTNGAAPAPSSNGNSAARTTASAPELPEREVGQDGTPPLPRRERGASSAKATEEALDLFGELEGDAGRSSLSDFKRGQEQAREDDR